MSRTERLGRLLAHPRLPWACAALALLLTLPALRVGWCVDDHFQRIALAGQDPFDVGTVAAWDLFRFMDGNEERNRRIMDFGMIPWWTLPRLNASFFRPLTALTHILDHRLWPDRPALAHLQSLLWYAALAAAAAGLYRRVMGPGWIAGLAGVLYAIDEVHGWPAGWLANRNALLAGLAGFGALAAHDRWRRAGWQPGAYLAPLALAVGLLAAEAAIATVAYLAAHALFLDRGSRIARLLRLVPYVGIVLVWWILHHAMGYGIYGSGLYLDPTYHPWSFAKALAVRAPVLLLGQIGAPSANYWIFVPPVGRALWWIWAVLVLAGFAALLPRILRDPVHRFWALGAVLSTVPVAATFPHDRLLVFVGLGTTGLLAALLAHLWRSGRRAWERAAAWALVALHVVWPLVGLPLSAWSPAAMGRIMDQDVRRVPGDPDLAGKTLVMVNPAIPFLAGYFPLLRCMHDLPAPERFRALGPGSSAMIVRRTDERTLEITAEEGFLSGPMDVLFRGSSHPFRPGDRVQMAGLEVQILSMHDRGRPGTVRFRFQHVLEDDRLVWLVQKDDRPAAWKPPPVGGEVRLPAVQVAPVHRLWERTEG